MIGIHLACDAILDFLFNLLFDDWKPNAIWFSQCLDDGSDVNRVPEILKKWVLSPLNPKHNSVIYVT